MDVEEIVFCESQMQLYLSDIIIEILILFANICCKKHERHDCDSYALIFTCLFSIVCCSTCSILKISNASFCRNITLFSILYFKLHLLYTFCKEDFIENLKKII